MSTIEANLGGKLRVSHYTSSIKPGLMAFNIART